MKSRAYEVLSFLSTFAVISEKYVIFLFSILSNDIHEMLQKNSINYFIQSYCTDIFAIHKKKKNDIMVLTELTRKERRNKLLLTN